MGNGGGKKQKTHGNTAVVKNVTYGYNKVNVHHRVGRRRRAYDQYRGARKQLQNRVRLSKDLTNYLLVPKTKGTLDKSTT